MCRARALTYDDEEKIGVLGDSSPKQLLETIIYMCGQYFAIQSETEHQNLQDGDIVSDLGRLLMSSIESSSKNNSRGL